MTKPVHRPTAGRPAATGADRLKVVLTGVLTPLLGSTADSLIPLPSAAASPIGVIIAGLLSLELSRLLTNLRWGHREHGTVPGSNEPRPVDAEPKDPQPNDPDRAGDAFYRWLLLPALLVTWFWLVLSGSETWLLRILLGLVIFGAVYGIGIFVKDSPAPVPQLALAGLLVGGLLLWWLTGLPASSKLFLTLSSAIVGMALGMWYVRTFRRMSLALRLRLPERAAVPGEITGQLRLAWFMSDPAKSTHVLDWTFRGQPGSDSSLPITVECSLADVVPYANYRLDVWAYQHGRRAFVTPANGASAKGSELLAGEVELRLEAVTGG